MVSDPSPVLFVHYLSLILWRVPSIVSAVSLCYRLVSYFGDYRPNTPTLVPPLGDGRFDTGIECWSPGSLAIVVTVI